MDDPALLRARLAERDRSVVLLTDQNTALRAQLATLTERLAELERQQRQNPRNSSKPPSSEGYAKPAPKSRRSRSGRAPGRQPGAPGTTLHQVADPDQVRRHVPARCAGCARPLDRAPVTSTEVRQVADLPTVALAWVEHRIEHRRCSCGTVTMAGADDGAVRGAGARDGHLPGRRPLPAAAPGRRGADRPVRRTGLAGLGRQLGAAGRRRASGAPGSTGKDARRRLG